MLHNHAKVKFGREIRQSIWTDNRWKAKLCQMKYWTLYLSKEMESWVTNYFCGTTLVQKRLDRNLHQFQVWAERKRGFPPINYFKIDFIWQWTIKDRVQIKNKQPHFWENNVQKGWKFDMSGFLFDRYFFALLARNLTVPVYNLMQL